VSSFSIRIGFQTGETATSSEPIDEEATQKLAFMSPFFVLSQSTQLRQLEMMFTHASAGVAVSFFLRSRLFADGHRYCFVVSLLIFN
jgi:hypothetical protein